MRSLNTLFVGSLHSCVLLWSYEGRVECEKDSQLKNTLVHTKKGMSHIAHILSHAPHMNAPSSSHEWLIHDSESCPAHEWLKKGLYKERPSRKKKFTGKFPTTLGSIQYAETPCILRLFFCKISLFWLLLTGSFAIDTKHSESIYNIKRLPVF